MRKKIFLSIMLIISLLSLTSCLKNDQFTINKISSMRVGDEFVLDSTYRVIWTVSDESVVFIDGKKLVAVGLGNALVTATAYDNQSLSMSFNVSVTTEIYDLTFDLNGGTCAYTLPLSYGEGVGLSSLPIPSKAHYNFDGWYAGETKYESISVSQTGDLALTAHWVDVNHTVTFDLNGGSSAELPTTFVERTGLATLPVPAKANYTFGGWYLNNQLVNEIAANTANDVTLVARWNEISHNITYVLDGGTNEANAPESFNQSEGLANLPQPSKTNLSFVGWYIGEELQTSIPAGTSSNVTLTAHWQEKSHNITYVLNDGTNSANAPTTFIERTGLASLPTATKANYQFDGWYVGNQKVTSIAANTTSDVTLVARWNEIVYGIVYDLNGGTNPSNAPTTYKQHLGVATLPIPTKEGYRFLSWGQLNGSIPVGTSENLLLVANWELIQHNITYVLNDGVNEVNAPSQFAEKDGLVQLPVPTKANYSFDGWYVNGAKVTSIAANKKEDVTLVANWKEITHEITYVLDGGENASSAPTTFKQHLGVASLPNPSKANYSFAGWYIGEVLQTSVAVGTAADVELTAKWNEIVHEVSYVLDGGENAASAPTTFNQSTGLVSLPVPSKTGHTFLGWYIGEVAQTSVAVGTSTDVILTAKWEVNRYLVTYNTNGGIIPGTLEDLGKELFNDFYNWLGLTSGKETFFKGTDGKAQSGGWYLQKAKLYAANKKGVGEANCFINDATYNAKWINFFNELDNCVKEVNAAQSFWASTWTGNIRLYEIWDSATRYTAAQKTRLVSHYSLSSETLLYGTNLPIPTKRGYNFMGWYINENQVETVPSACTVTAKWEAKVANVEFVLSGGKWLYTDKEKLNKENINITQYNDGFWSDYETKVFLYKVSDCVQYDLNPQYSNRIVIKRTNLTGVYEVVANYASGITKDNAILTGGEWVIIIFETNPVYNTSNLASKVHVGDMVEFDTDIISLSNKVVDFNGTFYHVDSNRLDLIYYTNLPQPEKESFVFAGWYQTSNFEGQPITQITDEQIPVKLYAKWVQTAQPVVFNLNGGQWNGDMKEYLSPSKSVTIHRFKMGAFDPNVAKVLSYPTQTTSPKYSDRILLVYDTTTGFYKVVDKIANGTTQAITECQYYIIVSGDALCDSYNLFNDCTIGQKVQFSIDLATASAGAIEFEAYFYSDSDLQVANVNYPINSQLPTPSKEGSTFMGWYNNPEFSGAAITSISEGDMSDSALQFYAKWA